MKLIRSVVLAVFATIVLILPGRAQDWPARSVRIVVPFGAGGSTDTLTRLLSDKLQAKFHNTPFIVENRPGAGGNIAGAAVATSAPDGYTFLMASPGILSYNKALYKRMSFDPDRDFEPVALYALVPNVLVVNPAVPAKNVAELIAHAKANPNVLNYGAIGYGATSFLSAELFKSMAGVEIQHVIYNAQALSISDLISGRIQLVIDNLISFLPMIRSGQLRALGMSTKVRSPLLPELPTISESGLPGYEALSWIMLVAPTGTPQTVLSTLAAAIKDVTEVPEFRARLYELGTEPVSSTRAEARSFIKQESEKWGEVIARTGTKIE
jgi:tripartite-type tricarboxylate transporter receptor subunit TctC